MHIEALLNIFDMDRASLVFRTNAKFFRIISNSTNLRMSWHRTGIHIRTASSYSSIGRKRCLINAVPFIRPPAVSVRPLYGIHDAYGLSGIEQQQQIFRVIAFAELSRTIHPYVGGTHRIHAYI